MDNVEEKQIVNVVEVPEEKKDKFKTAKTVAKSVLAAAGIFIAGVYGYLFLTR